MFISDSQLAPKPFAGIIKDTESTEKWLKYFERYVSFHNLPKQQVVQMFHLLMTDQAADWLHTMPDDIAMDLDQLKHEFQQWFALKDLNKWERAAKIWNRDQQKSESVDTYVTNIQQAASQINMDNDDQLR